MKVYSLLKLYFTNLTIICIVESRIIETAAWDKGWYSPPVATRRAEGWPWLGEIIRLGNTEQES